MATIRAKESLIIAVQISLLQRILNLMGLEIYIKDMKTAAGRHIDEPPIGEKHRGKDDDEEPGRPLLFPVIEEPHVYVEGNREPCDKGCRFSRIPLPPLPIQNGRIVTAESKHDGVHDKSKVNIAESKLVYNFECRIRPDFKTLSSMLHIIAPPPLPEIIGRQAKGKCKGSKCKPGKKSMKIHPEAFFRYSKGNVFSIER